MTRLILPGGTDVGEVALFAVDEIPSDPSTTLEAIEALAASEQLIRMPTGSDGGYLLHAYIDEQIPVDLMRFCIEDDPLRGRFRSVSGAIAFGGLESVFKGFKPNKYIRSDAVLTPAIYDFVAYRAEYPDDLIADEAKKAKGALPPSDRRLLSVSSAAIPLALLATFSAAVAQHFALAIGIGAASYAGLRTFARQPKLRQLRDRQEEWQLRFPSIVIELRSG